jgi:hypothetical protein
LNPIEVKFSKSIEEGCSQGECLHRQIAFSQEMEITMTESLTFCEAADESPAPAEMPNAGAGDILPNIGNVPAAVAGAASLARAREGKAAIAAPVPKPPVLPAVAEGCSMGAVPRAFSELVVANPKAPVLPENAPGAPNLKAPDALRMPGTLCCWPATVEAAPDPKVEA